MKQNQTITKLIETCVIYFEKNCYTKHRIERYKSMWRNGICRFMNNKGIENYDCSIGEEFIHLNISSMVTPCERDLIRSVVVLNEMQTTGKVSKRTVHPITRRLTGEIGLAAERFLDRQKELRRSSTTINDHLLYLYRFIQYLNNSEIILLRDINQHQVLSDHIQ